MSSREEEEEAAAAIGADASMTRPPKSSPIPSLPYDLILICVARVSRLYYPTLSLVSKSFRSLVSSPELYKTRSLLGFTESCLYVCLQTICDSTEWYTLCREPDKTLKDGSSRSGYTLAKVPSPNSPPAHFSSLVAVGSNIYNIATPASLNALPRFWILDCKSHTWIEAPSVRFELHSLSASVVDGKIYVAGHDYSLKSNCFEVLDTETGNWDSVSSETREERFWGNSISINGKFHVVTDEEVLAYDPKVGKWDMVGNRMGGCMFSDTYCVIGNVLYSASNGVFRWYDTEKRKWSYLKGLVGLPKITRDRGFIRLGDYGGKMVVFWGHVSSWPCFYSSYKKMEIWCAEIALEKRRDTGEIWGKVEWFDELLKIHPSYRVEKALSITL